MPKLFKDQFYSKSGKASINLDTEGLIEKVTKLQKSTEDLTKDRGVVEDLTYTLLDVSEKYIPYRDEYQIRKVIKKPSNKITKAAYKEEEDRLFSGGVNIPDRLLNKSKKQNLGTYLSPKRFVRFKSKVVKDSETHKIKGKISAEPDISWNGKTTEGGRLVYTPLKHISKYDTRKTRYSQYNSKEILAANKDDDRYGYHSVRDENGYYKKTRTYITKYKDEAAHALGESKEKGKQFADRPPHLRELSYDRVAKIVKTGNKFVVKFNYSIRKPYDKVYTENSGNDYGAIQYFGLNAKGGTGDINWDRFSSHTTSRWLEASVGALSKSEAAKIKGVPASEAKGNYDKLVNVVQKALIKRMKK